MKTIRIKIKNVKEKQPLTFTSFRNCKAQLKCLLSNMPNSCKEEAKDKYRWNIFCGFIWRINENILCDSLTSSMFPNITFLPSVKKPVLQLPSFNQKEYYYKPFK